MSEHTHSHPEPHAPTPPPVSSADAGSQALSEALRSSFAILKVVMVLLLLVFLASGFFTVGPQERAIILRLGAPVGDGQKALLLPGLHWSFPYPIDEYVKVSITGIQKVISSVGWYAITPEQELAGTEPPMGGSLTPGIDGSTLTADNNVIHSRATVTYRIEDPIRYVFGFVDAANSVQSALDNALLFASSQYKVDNMLTRDVIGFSELVRKRLVELVEQDRLGITVEQCTVQSVPPRQLKEAFANVLKAEVNRNKVLVEARSFENQILSKANADASSRVNSARSDRARQVAEISSRADQFQRLLPGYRDNPEVFVMRRLTETLGRVLTNVQDKIFVPENADGRSRELRYLFNREPKLKPEEPKR